MDDLDATIRPLSDLDRADLIKTLRRIDRQMLDIARGAGGRAKLGSSARNRAEEARANCDRLGRIIYFLQFRFPLPERDKALCEMLAEKLQAKGQWTGVYEI